RWAKKRPSRTNSTTCPRRISAILWRRTATSSPGHIAQSMLLPVTRSLASPNLRSTSTARLCFTSLPGSASVSIGIIRRLPRQGSSSSPLVENPQTQKDSYDTDNLRHSHRRSARGHPRPPSDREGSGKPSLGSGTPDSRCYRYKERRISPLLSSLVQIA